VESFKVSSESLNSEEDESNRPDLKESWMDKAKSYFRCLFGEDVKDIAHNTETFD